MRITDGVLARPWLHSRRRRK